MEAALQPLAEKKIHKRPKLPLGDEISDDIRDDLRGIDAPTRDPTTGCSSRSTPAEGTHDRSLHDSHIPDENVRCSGPAVGSWNGSASALRGCGSGDGLELCHDIIH